MPSILEVYDANTIKVEAALVTHSLLSHAGGNWDAVELTVTVIHSYLNLSSYCWGNTCVEP